MGKLFRKAKKALQLDDEYDEREYDWDSDGDAGYDAYAPDEEMEIEESDFTYEDEEGLEEADVDYYEPEADVEEAGEYYEDEEDIRYYESEEEPEENAGYYEAEGGVEVTEYYESEDDTEVESGYYESEGDVDESEYYEPEDDTEEDLGYYEFEDTAGEMEGYRQSDNDNDMEEMEYYGSGEVMEEEPGYYGPAEAMEEKAGYDEAEGEIEDAVYYEGEEEPEEVPSYYEAGEEIEAETYYEGEEEPEDPPVYYENGEETEGTSYYEAWEETGDGAYYESEEEPEVSPVYYEVEEDSQEDDGFYYGEETMVESAPEDRGRRVYAGGAVKKARPEQSRKRPEQKADKGSGFLTKLKKSFRNMDVMDKVMLATGTGIVILVIVTICVFLSSRIVEKQVSSFASVGTQLEGISTIGEQGLLAVADAEMARLAAASMINDELEEPPKKGYDETGFEKEVTVALNFTSIQKDLKIKFINKKTEKLVANVPFSVTVVGPDGKSIIWSDDDMDGIIYKKDITPGTYKVAMEALSDSKYSDYIISTETQSVEVKKDIEYKKVDVTNEVKQEKDVNAKKEDTKKNETVVESTLTDTVAWVESKVLASTYSEVAKSEIPDPATLVKAGNLLHMANLAFVEENEETGNGDGEGQKPDPGTPGTPGTPENPDGGDPPATTPPATDPPATTPPATDPPVTTPPATDPPATTPPATDPPATTPPATDPPATTPPATDPPATPTLTPTPTPTPTPTVTPTPLPVKVTVDNAAVSTVVGAAATATAKTENFTGVVVYSIESNNKAVATASIDAAGKVSIQGVAVGTAKLTITATGSSAQKATATIDVTVTGTKALTLNRTSMNILPNASSTITATLTNVITQDPAVTAESSNTNVAKVSVDKRTITVTGVAVGEATITVKFTENNAEIKATCVVNVKDSTASLLKDKEGRQVYVQVDNTYREATWADYYTAGKFFIKGGEKYTGWQTIDNKVYFFTADGNKVTGEQVIQGAKYNFASDGSLVTGSGVVGIDVSKWNGSIDWKAVKNSGISYVIIRCGYRGSSEGKMIEDPKFEANIKGATAAGLKVGVYFFSQAVDEIEAVEEASMVLGLIRNYTISYPVFIDVEASGGRGDNIDKETRTAVCKAFCQTIQNAGYTAGVYSNKLWLENRIDAGSLSNYKTWLAQYAANPTYKGKYEIWQYRATGSVSGISGNVDMNISYLGY